MTKQIFLSTWFLDSRIIYFTLFYLEPTKLISFDQYLSITSNGHWWIAKWWLWLYIYSLTSKWSDRASLFTIPSNDWWKVLIHLERSTKYRADFILPLTNKEGHKLLEGGPATWEWRWNDWWNRRCQRVFWIMTAQKWSQI